VIADQRGEAFLALGAALVSQALLQRSEFVCTEHVAAAAHCTVESRFLGDGAADQAAFTVEVEQMAGVAVARRHPRHDVGIVHQAVLMASQRVGQLVKGSIAGHGRLAVGVKSSQVAAGSPAGGGQGCDRPAQAVARHH
jgi:hypothetical protein